jgi:hypothetical protein
MLLLGLLDARLGVAYAVVANAGAVGWRMMWRMTLREMVGPAGTGSSK